MTFHLGRVEIHFSFWFFAVILGFALVGREALLLYFLLPIAVHELGHLAVMAVCRVGVLRISFTVLGVNIRRRAGTGLSYGGELAVCLGGVAANLLTALLLYRLCFQTMRMMLLVASNVAVAIFNLLPIGDLDGGQLVKLLTARFLEPGTAAVISKIASLLALTALFAFAILLALRGELNLTLFIACGYLAVYVIFLE